MSNFDEDGMAEARMDGVKRLSNAPGYLDQFAIFPMQTFSGAVYRCHVVKGGATVITPWCSTPSAAGRIAVGAMLAVLGMTP